MDGHRVEIVSSLIPMILGFLIGIVSIGGLAWVCINGDHAGWIALFSVASVIGLWAIRASIYGIRSVWKYGWSAGVEDEE